MCVVEVVIGFGLGGFPAVGEAGRACVIARWLKVRQTATQSEGGLGANQSVVVDLFQGQLKSTLECPECRTALWCEIFMFLSPHFQVHCILFLLLIIL